MQVELSEYEHLDQNCTKLKGLTLDLLGKQNKLALVRSKLLTWKEGNDSI